MPSKPIQPRKIPPTPPVAPEGRPRMILHLNSVYPQAFSGTRHHWRVMVGPPCLQAGKQRSSVLCPSGKKWSPWQDLPGHLHNCLFWAFVPLPNQCPCLLWACGAAGIEAGSVHISITDLQRTVTKIVISHDTYNTSVVKKKADRGLWYTMQYCSESWPWILSALSVYRVSFQLSILIVFASVKPRLFLQFSLIGLSQQSHLLLLRFQSAD